MLLNYFFLFLLLVFMGNTDTSKGKQSNTCPMTGLFKGKLMRFLLLREEIGFMSVSKYSIFHKIREMGKRSDPEVNLCK